MVREAMPVLDYSRDPLSYSSEILQFFDISVIVCTPTMVCQKKLIIMTMNSLP